MKSRKILRPYQVQWTKTLQRYDLVAILGARQIGKDFWAAFVAVLLAVETEHNVLCANKDQRQSTKFLAVVADVVNAMGRAGVPIAQSDSGKMTAIRLRADSGKEVVIQSLPGNPDAIQGFTGHIILNELGASRFSPEEAFEQAMAATSAHDHMKCIVITNATRRGSFLDHWWNSNDAKYQRLRGPFECMTTTIHDAYPDGLPKRILDRRDAYTRSAWARWMLCKFTSAGDGTFEKWIGEYAPPPWAEDSGGQGARRVLLADIGATAHPTGIVVMESTPHGWRDIHAEIVRRIPVSKQAAYLSERMRSFGAGKIVMDRGGPGLTVYQDLQALYPKEIIKGVSANRQRRAMGATQIQDMLTHGTIAIRSDELLDHLREITGDADAQEIVVPEMQSHDMLPHHCDLADALLIGAPELGSTAAVSFDMPSRQRARARRNNRVFGGKIGPGTTKIPF